MTWLRPLGVAAVTLGGAGLVAALILWNAVGVAAALWTAAVALAALVGGAVALAEAPSGAASSTPSAPPPAGAQLIMTQDSSFGSRELQAHGHAHAAHASAVHYREPASYGADHRFALGAGHVLPATLPGSPYAVHELPPTGGSRRPHDVIFPPEGAPGAAVYVAGARSHGPSMAHPLPRPQWGGPSYGQGYGRQSHPVPAPYTLAPTAQHATQARHDAGPARRGHGVHGYVHAGVAGGDAAYAHAVDAYAQHEDAYAQHEHAYASHEHAYASHEDAYAHGEDAYAHGEDAYAHGEDAYAHGEDAYAYGENAYAQHEGFHYEAAAVEGPPSPIVPSGQGAAHAAALRAAAAVHDAAAYGAYEDVPRVDNGLYGHARGRGRDRVYADGRGALSEREAWAAERWGVPSDVVDAYAADVATTRRTLAHAGRRLREDTYRRHPPGGRPSLHDQLAQAVPLHKPYEGAFSDGVDVVGAAGGGSGHTAGGGAPVGTAASASAPLFAYRGPTPSQRQSLVRTINAQDIVSQRYLRNATNGGRARNAARRRESDVSLAKVQLDMNGRRNVFDSQVVGYTNVRAMRHRTRKRRGEEYAAAVRAIVG